MIRKGSCGVRSRVYALPLIFLLLVTVGVPAVSSYTLRKVTDPVMSPGPTAPEAVLLGGDLRVEVNAGSGAGGWTSGLVSEYDSASMVFVNGSYVDGRGWALFFEVPVALRPGLYSLNIAYQDGSQSVDHTQPRSVWLLEEWPESITIGMIGDTHHPNNPDPLASYVHEVNLIRPDIVVYNGDVVELESTASGWIYLQSILDRLGVPLFLVPGNHDFISGGIYYEQYGGPTNYSRVIGDFLILCLTGRGGGYLPPDQLQWAESVLQRYPDKVKIVAHHKPIFSLPGGAEITGSWEEAEAIVDYMQLDWAQNFGAAQELLRLIEEYDVRLMITAHIHFDNVYVYNDRHYILSVSPCGGSVPEGRYDGQRLVEVDVDGNVYLDDYAIRDMFDPPNAIPVGNVTYYYKAANDGTETAVSATVVNDLEMELTDARLEFVVSGSQPAEDYVFYTTQPESYEVFTTEEGHHFIAYFYIPAQTTMDVTLAADADGAKPRIEITFPEDYEFGSEVPVTITAWDEGWGVQSLAPSYSTDGGETWTPVPLVFEPLVDRDNYVIDYPETSHTFTVADIPAGSELQVSVEALDYAGNVETTLDSFFVGVPQPTTHTLSVSTSPITGVSFKVGDGSHTTPYEEALEEGVYTITMPGEVTVGGVNYTLAGWDDGETDPERTVSLVEDTALTASYEEVEVEEPEPEPDQEKEPPRGIPIPTASVVMGVILGVLVVFYLNRRG
jgi:hypothetical protein